MNILFLSELYYPHYGGAELATHLYAKKLSEIGHKIIVLTHRFQGEECITQIGNTTIIRIPLINENSPKYSIQSRLDILLSEYFRKLVKWSNFIYIPRYWYTAIPVIKQMGKPVVVHLHDYLPVCSLTTLYDEFSNQLCENRFCKPNCVVAAEKYNMGGLKLFMSTLLNSTIENKIGKLVNLSDVILCVSKKHREVLVKKMSNISKKTYAIYNQMPDVAQIPLQKQEFGYFGGNSVIKGVNVLSKSIITLKERGKKVPKIHASKMLSGLYGAQNRAKNKTGIIKYGRLSLHEFNDLYGSIQTVLVPSIWQEPLPYVVAEALLRKRLVIASNIGGIPELLEGCKGAIKCDPGDPIKLAEAIEKIYSMNSEEKKELGIHNKDNFLKQFNNEVNIKKFLNIVEKII